MAERARLSRAQSKARTRAELLSAGGELFAELGFHAVTVEAIAERAGFTRGAFYANFADKADLFLTLLEERQTADMDEARVVVTTTPDEAKLGAIQAWFDGLHGGRRWGLAYAELWPIASRDVALRPRLAAQNAAERAAIAAMFDDYCASAGLTPAISGTEFGGMLLALGDGLGNQRLVDRDALPKDAFTRAMALLWLGAFTDNATALFGTDGAG